MNEQKKLYPERDPTEFVDYYMRHVEAMTSEELFGKGDIAAQLAWRDREIDQLRQRVAEVEAINLDAAAFVSEVASAANCLPSTFPDGNGHIVEAVRKLALAEQDARRYRVVRNNALWAKSHSGFVRWSIFLQMEEPPIDAASLTPDSVAQCLDAAIDAIDAAIDASGHDPLSTHKGGVD